MAKNKEKPFIIKSNESSIEVLGTQFNLKSYSNDNRIEVALLDGSVAFSYPSTTDQEMKCILSPGEQVYYNRTTHNLEKEVNAIVQKAKERNERKSAGQAHPRRKERNSGRHPKV